MSTLDIAGELAAWVLALLVVTILAHAFAEPFAALVFGP